MCRLRIFQQFLLYFCFICICHPIICTMFHSEHFGVTRDIPELTTVVIGFNKDKILYRFGKLAEEAEVAFKARSLNKTNMAPPTIRWAVAETLEDLSKKDFSRFCFVLPDRGIKSSAIEDKNPLEITTLLVDTFTEHGALKVVVEILRQIKSNQVADTLESKTKDCVDKGHPTFRKNSQGELDTNPSQEALAGKRPVAAPPKTPEEVVTEAKNRVRAEGGDLSNGRLILSRYTIQFGQYRDKTFKWLLENDARYAAWVVATHQLEPQQNNRQDPRMSNKDSLADYALFYPEVIKEVEHEKAKLRSQLPQQSGNYGPQKWKPKYKAETRFSPMKKKPRGSWRRT